MHGSRRRTAGAALACLALGTISLSACSAGPRAQTANQYSVVDGALANVGSISIRDAGVAAPQSAAGYASGATVQLAGQIVNNSNVADELIGVTTSGAKSVVLSTSAFSSPLPTPASDTASTTPATSGSASGSATSTATPTPSASTSSAAASTSIAIPGNAAVILGGTTGPSISLDGLTGALASGQNVSVTFTFRVAGSVTVQLPVKLVKDNTGGPTVDIEPSSSD